MSVPTIASRHVNHHQQDNANPGVITVNSAAGLLYAPSFLDADRMAAIVARIDASDWNTQIARRTQHYGWRYDYKARAITPDMYLGHLPDWLQAVADDLALLRDANGQPVFDRAPEQCIINEYHGRQGIAEHTDHPGFGPAIATVSLLADWEMDLKTGFRSRDVMPALLQEGSALFFTGDSRSVWTHAIQPKTHEADGRRRERRLSLTFRTVRNRDGVNDDR